MASEAPQRHTKCVSEKINVAVDCSGILDVGELLTGTPIVEEVGTNDLTLDDKALNTAVLTVNGEGVAVGQAVQFSVAAGVADTDYIIRITVATDATPAQTRLTRVHLGVEPD